ncbi:MAG: DJ-1/PfpI family protein [Methylothermaceae bacterium]|nr:DJ-1/PfpI family protein [Methylothermaceae bacterium]
MTAATIYGMYDTLCSAGRDWGIVTHGEPGPELIRPILVAREKIPFDICNGVLLNPHASIEECPETDIVCVPEVNLPPGTPLAERFQVEIAWLRRCYEAGKTLADSCSGAMLFAEAGLLDGHEATTHWAWCDAMTTRFPHIRLRAQQSLVVSGEGQRLVMAGGGTSFLDLTLYLVARTVGVEAAMQVAKVNLIDWHHVGQQPFA